MGFAPGTKAFYGQLALLLMLVPAFAGCNAKNFTVELPLWQAGYAWEYNEKTVKSTAVDGTAPSFAQDIGDTGEQQHNSTRRIEVFNATAASVEGIPIYATAVLQRTIPDNSSHNSTEKAIDVWDAWVFTADLNYAEPTYVDWRNQEVQLSGEQGGVSKDASQAHNDTNNQPQNEQRMLDWPLTRGHAWRHEERVLALDAPGVYKGQVTGIGNVRTPAGTFESVRLRGTIEPLDTAELQKGIRASLESQGAKIDKLDFQYSMRTTYAYAAKVMNLVQSESVQTVRLKASGSEKAGKEFDFTFTETTTTSRVLATFQTEQGVEKPLTFGQEVKRGTYAPKPITPASHLAVEILATTQGINTAVGDKVTFGVRIYNSTAGEKKLRAADQSYPKEAAETSFEPKYDHGYLEIVWQFDSVDRRNNLHSFKGVTADKVTMGAKDFPTHGWKQVRASLRLKNSDNTTDPIIFTDYVAFEVYYHFNKSYARAAQNVTDRSIVLFQVEPSATRVTIFGNVQSTPADVQCPIKGSQDCLRVTDAGNKQVVDDRSESMKFETTRVGQYALGAWKVEYSPGAPGQTVTFEIIVRYRLGA
jgi:hypothetical protein